MPLSHDTILLETVRTRRARLHAALLHGGPARRRVVPDNLKRFVGSLVAAAVVCAGCVGFAVVTTLLAGRGASGQSIVDRPTATSPAAGPGAGARP
jgi:hypothetical protein